MKRSILFSAAFLGLISLVGCEKPDSEELKSPEISVSTALAEPNTLSESEKADGWALLFNGKDMSSFRNYKKEDVNENGSLKTEPSRSPKKAEAIL